MNRICFISHKSSLGGAETSLLSGVRALENEGHKCHVILPQQGPLVNALEKEGVESKIIYFKHWVTNRPALRKKTVRAIINRLAVPLISRNLKTWNIDVVITNTMTPLSGALAACKCNKSHIWHIREFGQEDHNYVFDKGLNKAMALIDKLSTLVICNSKAVAQKYRQYIDPQKIKILYNAVPIDNNYCDLAAKNYFKNPSSYKCIMIGSVSERKNQLEAVKAIYKLTAETSIHIELLLVGPCNTAYKKELDRYIQYHGIEDKISFVGEIANPFPFLKRADILLLCSKMEAFGKVTIEAMKCGVPVIASNTGGTTELVRHKHNGLLYELGKASDLAEKLHYMIKNPEEAMRIAVNAGRYTQNRFTIEDYGKKLSHMIDEVIV